jgi:hypothetical protein
MMTDEGYVMSDSGTEGAKGKGRTEGDDANGLEEAIIDSQQGGTEFPFLRARNTKPLSDNCYKNDRHADQGQRARFRQLQISARFHQIHR